MFGWLFWPLWQANFSISLRNLIIPTGLAIAGFILLSFYLGIKRIFFRQIILIIFILLSFFDLSHQALKYNPFTPKEILFPNTEVLNFLKNEQKNSLFRAQIIHQELFTSNFNLFYGIEMIGGYDSFHASRYEELALAANFEDPKRRFESPGRVLFLSNHRSSLFDLINVKYILALEEIKYPDLKLVFEKGKTKVYENLKVYPRVYLSSNYEIAKDDEEILAKMLAFSKKSERKVILEENINFDNYDLEKNAQVKIEENNNQSLKLKTEALQKSILVLSDAYDLGWKAWVDGNQAKIYRANYNFRAVVVPAGEHQVIFKYEPLSFKIGIYLSSGTLLLLLLNTIILWKRKRF